MNGRRPKLGRALGVFALAMLVAVGLQAKDANPAVPQTSALTSVRADTDPGRDPSAGVWDRAPETQMALTAQQTTYPFGGGSIPVVRVRSLHFQKRIYVRIEWDDSTKDDSTASVEQFADAVALELPATPGSTVPSVCMGQADSGVNIWQWRADRESALARAETHTNGYVDDDQSTADRAREVDNPSATARRPVQDLVAQGFGTLGPAEHQAVAGRGLYGGSNESGHWAVVLARGFQAPGEGQPAFKVGERTDIAFAVWNGIEGDRDGIKSVSEFATLVVSRSRVVSVPSSMWWFIGAAALLLLTSVVFWILRSNWFKRAR
ncbi:MAG TPA: ethylbenzene dehydrogenase-related protein [Nocardioidaceae bacterium]|nr:ethylbenzene dehydrogenase-related protein [Nocardioidaceae bacterium]